MTVVLITGALTGIGRATALAFAKEGDQIRASWGGRSYGDVTIRGTGQTFEPLRQIDRPIDFRNEVTAR